MLSQTIALAMVFLVGAQVCRLFGQAPATILVVDFENITRYVYDVADPLKFATDPGVTTPASPSSFFHQIYISDIVAVNGQPAKGTQVLREQVLKLQPNPAPGGAIADIRGGASAFLTWEILKLDGTPIGTLVGEGFSGSNVPPAPGAALAAMSSNIAIVGGTGAFLGARGVSGQGVSSAPVRAASITEDPSNRRNRPGGKGQSIIYLIPMERPEVTMTANGPAVTHSTDFSLVTTSKPAAPGEILSLFATGLGPTRPGVDPGKPFPADPSAVVNSPIDVTVNGSLADILGAVGLRGTVGGYQVNFRVPPDTAKGSATIQVTAAWIAGAPVSIAIQ